MRAAVQRIVVVILTAVLLAACASTGITPGPRNDDAPELTIEQAIGALNAFRSSSGVPPLAEDAALDTQAVQTASTIALLGGQSTVNDVLHVLYAPGFERVEEAIAVWRRDPASTVALLDPGATKAGIGAVVYGGKGAYWILLLK